MPQCYLHRWIVFYSFIPLLLHKTYTKSTGHTIDPIPAFGFYFLAFNAILIYQVHIVRRLSHKYGFLNGKHERDGVPDIGVSKVVKSLFKTPTSRMILSIILSYTKTQTPSQISWLYLSFKIGVYGLILDFWFHRYHRLMHDVGYLWKYRTHHLIKHPNPLLVAYADHGQEFFDKVVVPVMVYFSLEFLGFSMGFYGWWICHQYVAFGEVMAYCGLRMYLTIPSTFNWFLQILGSDLVEDHDLHHHMGWRRSFNYGEVE